MVIKELSIAMSCLKLKSCAVILTIPCIYLLSEILFLFATAHAGAEVFKVRDVRVDITSETAAKARNLALREGQARAFSVLLKRLTLSKDLHRIPNLENKEITEYVRDLEINDEKNSSVRYLANLEIRFKVDLVRSLLVDFDIPFSETMSEPLLILPIYQKSKLGTLWDGPNLWREAWENYDGGKGLVPLLHPAGDLRDIGIIDVDNALRGNKQSLGEISTVYKTTSVAVVHAVFNEGLSRNQNSLQVFLSIHRAQDRFLSAPLNFVQSSSESEREFLNRVVLRIIESINDDWKEANIFDLSQQNILAITIPVTGLNDWLKIQRKLATVFLITGLDMVLLSLDEIRVNIHYVGKMRQLNTALRQIDLNLKKEDSELVLYLSEKK